MLVDFNVVSSWNHKRILFLSTINCSVLNNLLVSCLPWRNRSVIFCINSKQLNSQSVLLLDFIVCTRSVDVDWPNVCDFHISECGSHEQRQRVFYRRQLYDSHIWEAQRGIVIIVTVSFVLRFVVRFCQCYCLNHSDPRIVCTPNMRDFKLILTSFNWLTLYWCVYV